MVSSASSGDRDEESAPLLSGREKQREPEPRSSHESVRLGAFILLAFLASLAFAVINTTGYQSIKKSLSSLFTSTSIYSDEFNHPDDRISKIARVDYYTDPSIKYSSIDEIAVIASNEYGQFEAPYPWMSEIEGTQLVEPYKETQLELVGSIITSGLYTFQWNLTDYDNSKFNPQASSQKIILEMTGTRQLTIQAFDQNGDLYRTFSTLIVTKYVKREIRSLTDRDREAFLNAASAMWKYSEVEGKGKFGDNYVPISTFVAAHSYASNDIMCDGFHDGSGFITHHLALGNSFEASLRAIDPMVTVPYWDFSIEGEAVDRAGETPSYMLQVTPIFSDEWFGEVDEYGHIKNSRWAHSKIPVQMEVGSGVKNSYGFIRSYWNNNNDPEVTRKLFSVCGVEAENKVMPNCQSHLDVLNSSTLGVFQLLSPGEGHGPMHVHLGGVWGGCEDAYAAFVEKWADVLDQDMTDDEINALDVETSDSIEGGGWSTEFWSWGNTAPRRKAFEMSVMGEYFHIYRGLWRSHKCSADQTGELLKCPENCDPDNTPFEECTCQVDALVNGETSWENLYTCLLGNADTRTLFSAIFPEEALKDMVYMVSTSPVKEGDMIESASTADILFWIIHPAVERLLAAKRLTNFNAMGPWEFQKFPSLTKDDWLQYSVYDLAEGVNAYHPEEFTCYGHGADDDVLPSQYSLPYSVGLSGILDQDGDGNVSNWEFFEALDPNNVYGSDYVFDNFHWDHCQEATYDTAVRKTYKLDGMSW